MRIVVNIGCLQGRVISPLLWCLVVDTLINSLNRENIYTQGYADDLGVIVTTQKAGTASGLVKTALRITKTSCDATGLLVNPDKTELVIFTRKGFRRPEASTLDAKLN